MTVQSIDLHVLENALPYTLGAFHSLHTATALAIGSAIVPGAALAVDPQAAKKAKVFETDDGCVRRMLDAQALSCIRLRI